MAVYDRRVVLSGGAGFNPKKKGERKRKTVRGNIITDEIVQINMKIVERPAKRQKRLKPRPSKHLNSNFAFVHA